MELPITTPYWRMLKEIIKYHRLMLYQSMMESKEERLGRGIIMMQKESERKDNWYGETEEAAKEV